MHAQKLFLLMDRPILDAWVSLICQPIVVIRFHHLLMELLALLGDGLVPASPIWSQLRVSLPALLSLPLVPLHASVHLLQGISYGVLGGPVILQLQLSLLHQDVPLLLGLHVVLPEGHWVPGKHLSVTAFLFWWHNGNCIVDYLDLFCRKSFDFL